MKPLDLFLNVSLFLQMNQIKDAMIEHKRMQQGCVEMFYCATCSWRAFWTTYVNSQEMDH